MDFGVTDILLPTSYCYWIALWICDTTEQHEANLSFCVGDLSFRLDLTNLLHCQWKIPQSAAGAVFEHHCMRVLCKVACVQTCFLFVQRHWSVHPTKCYMHGCFKPEWFSNTIHKSSLQEICLHAYSCIASQGDLKTRVSISPSIMAMCIHLINCKFVGSASKNTSHTMLHEMCSGARALTDS